MLIACTAYLCTFGSRKFTWPLGTGEIAHWAGLYLASREPGFYSQHCQKWLLSPEMNSPWALLSLLSYLFFPLQAQANKRFGIYFELRFFFICLFCFKEKPSFISLFFSLGYTWMLRGWTQLGDCSVGDWISDFCIQSLCSDLCSFFSSQTCFF